MDTRCYMLERGLVKWLRSYVADSTLTLFPFHLSLQAGSRSFCIPVRHRGRFMSPGNVTTVLCSSVSDFRIFH